jgi:hypothetical protein
MPTKIDDKKANFALEAWKKTIEVQQHFNTIEMQIRNFAITVLTATIGAAGLIYSQSQENIREAIKANQPIPSTIMLDFWGLHFSSADMIIIAGAIGWLAFYVMDRWWYHKFLYGAVKHAESIEEEIEKTQYGKLLYLTHKISSASHLKFFKWEVKSTTRINIFYLTGFLFQLILLTFVF